jgi:protein-disulfide isomerase
MEEFKSEIETEIEVAKNNEPKKIKNLLSLVILLAGLFLGSLFVDIGQLISGSGFSAKNLNKSDIFTAYDKTWVAYSEPAVTVSVISDDTCENCDPGEALVWLRRVVPTISTKKIDYDSVEGKNLVSKFGIKTLPAFIFGSSIDKTEFYGQAQVLFEPKEGEYVMNTQELGLVPGKYLELPKINESDALLGSPDAKVKVVIFSDFQCPYCKIFYESQRATMKERSENVVYDFKELPLDEIHSQANGAALASQCALEQGKFWEYADKLYATQVEWSAAANTGKFKEYARTLGLKADEFNTCLDGAKYQEKINADKNEAAEFGISGTPAIFVNDKVENGAITAEQLKASIDEELNK